MVSMVQNIKSNNTSFFSMLKPQYQGVPSILAFVGASTLMGVDRRRPQGKVVSVIPLALKRPWRLCFSGGQGTYFEALR